MPRADFDGVRYYQKEPDSLWHPSVTEIIACVRDPGLEAWQVKYCVEHQDRHASEQFGELHANYGNMVHGYLEAGEEEPAHYDPTPVRNAMRSWQLFKLELGMKLEIIATQIEVYGPDYGGTTDLVVRMNGIKTGLEIKTSAALRNRAALQAEAYFRALPPELEVEQFYCLRLGKNRVEYELREPDHEVAWRKFRACRELFDDRDPWATASTTFVPMSRPMQNAALYEYG